MIRFHLCSVNYPAPPCQNLDTNPDTNSQPAASLIVRREAHCGRSSNVSRWMDVYPRPMVPRTLWQPSRAKLVDTDAENHADKVRDSNVELEVLHTYKCTSNCLGRICSYLRGPSSTPKMRSDVM